MQIESQMKLEVNHNPKVQGQEGNQQDKHSEGDVTNEQVAYGGMIQQKTVEKAIEEANKKLIGGNRECQFSVHEKTKQILVKIIDTNTKEVIKEIPSEKILDMVAGFMENAGLLIDEKR